VKEGKGERRESLPLVWELKKPTRKGDGMAYVIILLFYHFFFFLKLIHCVILCNLSFKL